MTAKTHLFPCLQDNYGVLVHDQASGATAAIDAPEAAPVEAALNETGWTLSDILVTHHHGDHTGGIAGAEEDATTAAWSRRATKWRAFPWSTQTVGEGDIVKVGDAGRAGHRDARSYRRPYHLLVRQGCARLRRRHAVLDRLRPGDRGHARDDVGIAAEARAPSGRNPGSIAATNTRWPTSASPRPSSPTIRRWRRAPPRRPIRWRRTSRRFRPRSSREGRQSVPARRSAGGRGRRRAGRQAGGAGVRRNPRAQE